MGSKRISLSSSQVPKNTENNDKIDMIDFDSWFYKKVLGNRLRDFQRNEIKVFFSEAGLKNKELEVVFEDKLKSF